MGDNVNHPDHYTAYNGIEVIQLTEQMNFCRGNAVKYICRAGLKSAETEIEDLEKAIWYLQREIRRISPKKPSEAAQSPSDSDRDKWERIYFLIERKAREIVIQASNGRTLDIQLIAVKLSMEILRRDGLADSSQPYYDVVALVYDYLNQQYHSVKGSHPMKKEESFIKLRDVVEEISKYV